MNDHEILECVSDSVNEDKLIHEVSDKVVNKINRKRKMHTIIREEDLEPGQVSSFSIETGYGFLDTASGPLYFHSASQRYCIIDGDDIILSQDNPSKLSSRDKEPDKWVTIKPRNAKNCEEKVFYLDPRLAINAKLLFFRKKITKEINGETTTREAAVAWCFQDDYLSCRNKLTSRPMYRLLKRYLKPGKPVSDNKSRTFVTPEEECEEEIFCGSDMDGLKYQLRKTPLEPKAIIKTDTGNVQVDCQWQFQKNVNGHWLNCGHPLETSEDCQ